MSPLLSRLGSSNFGFNKKKGGGGGFNTLVATDIYTSPFTSSSRSYRFIEFISVGAGGADNTSLANQTGGAGQGGFTVARFVVPTSTTLLYAVGTTGSVGTPGPGVGGAGWSPTIGNGGSGYSYYPPAGSYGGGGGGGLTGVFATPSAPGISQASALLIAGGGGGNRYSGGIGGNGGGSTATTAPTPGTGTGGGGGTQLSGGTAGLNQPGSPPATATQGTALTGGDGSSVPAGVGPSWAYGGGGGGAGYFGGGGGGGSNSSSGANSAGGGGGSGYINASSPYYFPSPTIERNYTGMGEPTMGTGGGTYPLGAGKDHPQIAPYWASTPTKYGAGAMPGILIVNYYS